ncbi:MAG: extracellular solute-binding protein, partial [Anaerolineales bacterium]|nr:extracellular solute-binding protein [Anaerolineales bacterium]
MKLSHLKARRLINKSFDHSEPSGDGRFMNAALETHLAECQSCRQYADEMLQLENRLSKQMPSSLPFTKTPKQELEGAIRRVKKQSRRRQVMNHFTTLTRRAAWAAIIVASIVGIIWATGILRPDEAATTDSTPTIRLDGEVELDEPVLITFADMGIFQSQYEPLIEEFESLQSNIQVQFLPFEEVPGGFTDVASYADVVKRGAPVGDDIYNYLDLTPLIEADPDFDAQAFWPNMLEGCSVDGRMLGLPVAGRPNLIVFDGAAFDAAGLPRPAPGWSWQDFETAVATLTHTSGEEVLRYGFVDSGWPLTLLAPRLDAILTSSPGDPDLSTLQSELDWFVSLANEGAVHMIPFEENSYFELQELIDNRQVAMWVDSSGIVSTRLAALGAEGGVAPYPIPSPGEAARTTWVNAECLLVSAGTAHPQEAWNWMQFLASQRLPSPAQAGAVPARPSVADDSRYWDLLDEPVAAAFRFALENAWYGSISLEPLHSIGQALSQAMRGESTLAAALAEIQIDPGAPAPPAATTPLAVATPQPPSAAATPPPGAVVIDFFYHGIDYTSLEAVEAVADAFHQENPDIFVRLIDWGSHFRMDEGFNAITLADRFDCFTTTIPPTESGFDSWYSLNPLIDADPEGPAIIEEIPAGWLEFHISRGDGILYAIPLAAQPHVIYFNKDLLESMGLQPPDLNWTMDDFWALATGAASRNSYGFVHKSDHNFFFEWKSLFPLWDFSVSLETINFDSPETLATLSFLVDMAEMRAIAPITPGSPRNNWSSGYHTRYQAISAGKAAMWTDYAGNIHDAYTFPDGLPFEIGLVPLPVDIPPQWATQTIQFYISRQAENPEACWEWLKFLSSQPVIFQGIPLRSSVLASPDLEAFLGVETAAAYRAVMARPVREFVSRREPFNSVPIFWWWNETLEDIFNGADPQRALTKLRQKAEVYR